MMDSYEEKLLRADKAVAANDADKALMIYQDAIETAPQRPDAYYDIAVLYSQQHQFELAVNFFNKAAEINQSDETIYNNLGVLYYSHAEYYKAEQNFIKALRLKADYQEALYGLANTYSKQNKIFKAYTLLEKLLSSESNSDREKIEAALDKIYERRAEQCVKESIKKILLVKLGDPAGTAMLTPTLQAIRQYVPEVEITVLGKKESLAMLNGLPVKKITSVESDEKYSIGFYTDCSSEQLPDWGETLKAQCDGTLLKLPPFNIVINEIEHYMEMAHFLGYTGITPEIHLPDVPRNQNNFSSDLVFLKDFIEPKNMAFPKSIHLDVEMVQSSFKGTECLEYENVKEVTGKTDLLLYAPNNDETILAKEIAEAQWRFLVTLVDYAFEKKCENIIRRTDIEAYALRIFHRLPSFYVYEKIRCPLCGNTLRGPVVKDMLFCSECGIHRKRYVLPAGALKNRLKNIVIGTLLDSKKTEQRISEAEEQLDWIERTIPQKGSLFDVGASGGFMLKAARDRGWRVDGNEISLESIKWAKENFDLNLKYGLLNDLDVMLHTFNAVILWHTLEHTIDFRETIETVREILCAGGYAVIAVPIKTSQEEIFKAYEDLHNYEFSIDGLNKLMGQNGFVRLECREAAPTGVREYHAIYKIA